jgi:hypothetical protein
MSARAAPTDHPPNTPTIIGMGIAKSNQTSNPNHQETPMHRQTNWKALFVVAGLALGLGTGLGYFLRSSAPMSSTSDLREINAVALLSAARAHTQDLQSRDLPVPELIPMEDLILGGWLKEEDVAALANARVWIASNPDETRPQQVLVRVQLSPTEEIVALADGSVQQTIPGRF